MGGGASDPTKTVSRPGANGPTLRIFVPGRPPLRAPLRDGLVLGRGADADVVIDHESVSRRHLAFAVADHVAVEDLGGKNGTWVAGRKLGPKERVVLAPSAIVEIGEVSLLVDRGAATDDEAPASVTFDDDGAPMTRVERLVALVATSDVSVLLTGETGVGKDVRAETIHRLSLRRDQPFVAINCAAIAENLLDSELFGYERGAFTGATAAKIGLLESAMGGTVFLDELGELPPSAQAKLLRAIEKREVVPVGGTKPRPFDARFIGATHRDLEAWVADGRFRMDLYFRLNGLTIDIPPLRERLAEIGDLATMFAEQAARKLGRPAPTLTDEALSALRAHPWPGNLRELRNVMERAVLVSGSGVLRPAHFKLKTETAATAAPAANESGLGEEVRMFERQRLEAALAKFEGNQTRAAKSLGITRAALLYRMRLLGIDPSRFRPA